MAPIASFGWTVLTGPPQGGNPVPLDAPRPPLNPPVGENGWQGGEGGVRPQGTTPRPDPSNKRIGLRPQGLPFGGAPFIPRGKSNHRGYPRKAKARGGSLAPRQPLNPRVGGKSKRQNHLYTRVGCRRKGRRPPDQSRSNAPRGPGKARRPSYAPPGRPAVQKELPRMLATHASLATPQGRPVMPGEKELR